MMIGLLTLGTAASFVVASLVLQLFEVASVWNDLLNAAQNRQDWIMHIYKGNAWSLCVFLASFNTAHWIFAMQYWSLAIKLQLVVQQKQVKHLGLLLKLMFYVGEVLQCLTGYLSLFAFNHEGAQYNKKAIENWADFMNIFP